MTGVKHWDANPPIGCPAFIHAATVLVVLAESSLSLNSSTCPSLQSTPDCLDNWADLDGHERMVVAVVLDQHPA